MDFLIYAIKQFDILIHCCPNKLSIKNFNAFCALEPGGVYFSFSSPKEK